MTLFKIKLNKIGHRILIMITKLKNIKLIFKQHHYKTLIHIKNKQISNQISNSKMNKNQYPKNLLKLKMKNLKLI